MLDSREMAICAAFEYLANACVQIVERNEKEHHRESWWKRKEELYAPAQWGQFNNIINQIIEEIV